MCGEDLSCAVLSPSENVSWRKVNGELIVLNLDSGEYFTFQGIAHVLWEYIVQGKTPAEITATVIDEYAVAESSAKADVSQFITSLLEKRVIVRKGQEIDRKGGIGNGGTLQEP